MSTKLAHGYKIETKVSGKYVGCVTVQRWDVDGLYGHAFDHAHHFFNYPLRPPRNFLWWQIEQWDVRWSREYNAQHPVAWTWCESLDDAIVAAAHFIKTGKCPMPRADRSIEDRIAVELELMDEF